MSVLSKLSSLVQRARTTVARWFYVEPSKYRPATKAEKMKLGVAPSTRRYVLADQKIVRAGSHSISRRRMDQIRFDNTHIGALETIERLNKVRARGFTESEGKEWQKAVNEVGETKMRSWINSPKKKSAPVRIQRVSRRGIRKGRGH